MEDRLEPDAIVDLITSQLPDARVALEDLTGGGDHWRATVVSSAFTSQGRVTRHRMVYAALGDAMRGPIHALALSTLTPEEAGRQR